MNQISITILTRVWAISSYGSTPEINTYALHLSLFGWVYLHKTNHTPFGMLCVGSNDQAMHDFTQDVVLNVIGSKPLVMRFEQALKDGLDNNYGQCIMTCMSQLAKHPRLQSLLQKRKIMKQVVARLNRRSFATEWNEDQHLETPPMLSRH